MGFDPVVQLVVNGPQAQVAFQFLERLLDLGELEVVLPECGRIGCGENPGIGG